MYFKLPTISLRLLCFFTCSYFFAQESTIHKDSLNLYSYQELDSICKVNYFSDPATSKKYAEISLQKATRDQNDERMANALLRIAMMEGMFENFEKAHELLDRAIYICKEKVKDKDQANQYLFFKGNLYYEEGNYIEALEAYTKVKTDTNATHSLKDHDINYSIAIIKNIIGDHEGSLKLLKENYAFFVQQEKNNPNGLHTSSYLGNMIAINTAYLEASLMEKKVARKKKFLDSADYYNTLGLKKSITYNDRSSYNYLLIRKGISLYEKGQYQESINDLMTALQEAEDIPQKSLIPLIYFHLARNHHKLSHTDFAENYFLKVDSLASYNSRYKLWYPFIYSSLSSIYIQKKDTEKATKYLNLIIESKKENEAFTNDIWSKMYELHDTVVLKNKIQKLSDQTEKTTSKLYISISIIFLLSMIFISYMILHKKKQRKNRLAFDKLIQELELKKKEVFQLKPTQSIKKTTTTLSIDQKKVQDILKALDKFEQKEQFLNPNCDLAFVVKKTKTNKAYLSRIINTHKGSSFIQYITKLRIDYVLERLRNDKVFRSYDIASISSDIGFKSPDTFSRAFKARTGINPSYYIKTLNQTT